MSSPPPNPDLRSSFSRSRILAELRRAVAALDVLSPLEMLRALRDLRYGGDASISRVVRALETHQTNGPSTTISSPRLCAALDANRVEVLSLVERHVVERMSGLHPTAPPPDEQHERTVPLLTRGSGRFLDADPAEGLDGALRNTAREEATTESSVVVEPIQSSARAKESPPPSTRVRPPRKPRGTAG